MARRSRTDAKRSQTGIRHGLVSLLLVPLAVAGALPADPVRAAATAERPSAGFLTDDPAGSEDAACNDKQAIGYLQEEFGYDRETAVRFLSDQPDLMRVAGMAATSFPEHVGGTYFDHSRGGILVVPVAGDTSGLIVETLTQTITSRWPELRDRTEIVTARASLADLEHVAEVIEEQLVAAEASTWSIGFDHRNGTVELVVSTKDAESADAAARTASALTEIPRELIDITTGRDPVIVEELDACTAPARCDPPFRGGLRISGCTSGFMAQNPAGSYDTITAGHCGSRIYSHTTDTQGTRTVGGAPLAGTYTETGWAQDDTQQVQQNSRVDAARIFINDPDYWRRGRNVFLYSNVNYSTMLHAWSCPASLPQHTFLHRAGGITGTSTGTVQDAMYTYRIDGVPRRDKLLASYNRNTGDSGAPVLVRSDNRGVPGATGIAIHKSGITVNDEPRAVSSHIRFVEDLLEIRMRDSIRVCS